VEILHEAILKIFMALKLFVWEDVLCDYTSGIMFALAEDVEQARYLIGGDDPLDSVLERDLKGEPEVYTEPVGFFLYGGG
jgi:hypothetical protein